MSTLGRKGLIDATVLFNSCIENGKIDGNECCKNVIAGVRQTIKCGSINKHDICSGHFLI